MTGDLPTIEQSTVAIDSDLGVAMSAALAGAAVGRAHFRRLDELEVRLKSDDSPVSDADVAVETTVREALLSARPDDAVLGEETGGSESDSDRRWILDGIDGTAAFINGDDRWQSLVALEIDGIVQVGVAVVPEHREVWFAQRGTGAFRQAFDDNGLIGEPERLTTNQPKTPPRVALIPTVPYLSESEQSRVASLLATTKLVDPTRHGALLVAGGTLDICVELDGEPWDYPALQVIVEEAGGAFESKPIPGSTTARTGVFAAEKVTGLALLELVDKPAATTIDAPTPAGAGREIP